MEYMELNDSKVKVSAMGIADFLAGVTTKIKEGYEMNYEDNDMYPIAYGGYFEVVLEKVSADETDENKDGELKEESKRGRKSKSV